MQSLKISDKLKDLKGIPMPTCIDYVHDYRKVDITCQSLSIWAWIIIILSTVFALGIIVFIYKKNIFGRRCTLTVGKGWLVVVTIGMW